MIHKVPCPHCKGSLYEIVVFDDHSQGTAIRPSLRLVNESLTCPHCGKGALRVKTIGLHGFPLFKAA